MNGSKRSYNVQRSSETTEYVNQAISLESLNTTLERTNEQYSIKTKNAIAWSDLDIYVHGKKKWFPFTLFSDKDVQILKNVSGRAESGELFAVLGASGSGKTTLLNVISGRNTGEYKLKGKINVNGKVTKQNTLKLISGYVQQNDLFMDTFTVYEHLVFQTALKMDAYFTSEQRTEKVKKLIVQFGLKKCMNTVIGSSLRLTGISNGERKRLSIASELISDPFILILDEPTTGLDSFIAEKVMQTLKLVAKDGTIVICSIHQPSSNVYSMFDQMLFLTDGHVAFTGSNDEARRFFSSNGFVCPINHNPADYYISKLSIDPENEENTKATAIRNSYLSTRYEDYLRRVFDASTPNYTSLVDKINSGYKRSFFVQFYHLFSRCCVKATRDPSQFGQLIIVFIWALICGSTFYSSRNSTVDVTKINAALFYILILTTYQSAFLSALTCLLEFDLFSREHRENGLYSSAAYYWSKCLFQFILTAVSHGIFISLIYPIVNLNWHFENFIVAVTAIVLSSFCSEAMADVIAYSVKSLPISLVLVNNAIGFLFILSGFFFPFRLFPKYFSWMKHVDWLYYAYKLLIVNQWKTIGQFTCTETLSADQLYTNDCEMSGKDVIDHFEYEYQDFVFDVSLLFGTIFVLRIIASIILYLRS